MAGGTTVVRGDPNERGSGLGVLVGVGTFDTPGPGRGKLAGARTVGAAGRAVSTLGVGTGGSGLGGSNILGEGRAGGGVAWSEGLGGRCNERGVGGGRGSGGIGGNTGVVDLGRSGLVSSERSRAGHTLGASTEGTGGRGGGGSL